MVANLTETLEPFLHCEAFGSTAHAAAINTKGIALARQNGDSYANRADVTPNDAQIGVQYYTVTNIGRRFLAGLGRAPLLIGHDLDEQGGRFFLAGRQRKFCRWQDVAGDPHFAVRGGPSAQLELDIAFPPPGVLDDDRYDAAFAHT
jgi:hypothetical protein